MFFFPVGQMVVLYRDRFISATGSADFLAESSKQFFCRNLSHLCVISLPRKRQKECSLTQIQLLSGADDKSSRYALSRWDQRRSRLLLKKRKRRSW